MVGHPSMGLARASHNSKTNIGVQNTSSGTGSLLRITSFLLCRTWRRTLWNPFLPQHIERIGVSYHSSAGSDGANPWVHVNADITSFSPVEEKQYATIMADKEASLFQMPVTEVKIEGLKCVALAASRPEDDYVLYSAISWKPCISNGIVRDHNAEKTLAEDKVLVETYERMALFYYKSLRALVADVDVPLEHRPDSRHNIRRKSAPS
ncbi:hypothetical protein CC80DRAFT_571169 [Byssothecium circinans]|uniref:Uncharacterized protein n=1 Tax=Byssothecium circinans TaxID=147558 RepID=A0A6A5TMB2_9PLEO|nr:hypothetical protein CC80DRAFT_571169 [Byssothecium circinans]